MSRSAKEELRDVYTSHHERGRRYNYIFCYGERGSYLKEWIGKGKTILDLGCRDGALTQFFADQNKVIGADIDQKALSITKDRLNIETHWLDLNGEWPFPRAAFDVVVACEIMEHLFFPTIVLERIKSSLKPGGMFIGSVPNAFRLQNRWKFLQGKEFDNDPTHVRFFSYDKLCKMLSTQFQKVEIFSMRGKILPFWPLRPNSSKRMIGLFGKHLLWKATLIS
ncbi:MAG: class I SAM-dependent methyltransferase [Chlamydiae bacterium]|nr:class I SAM-dependent methyltransferase [Chlamydiota bacterium]